MDNNTGREALETIDPRLLAEALRRARGPEPEASPETAPQLAAIVAAVQTGARDMFSLVTAAHRATLTDRRTVG